MDVEESATDSDKENKCNQCSKHFSSKYVLNRHLTQVHKIMVVKQGTREIVNEDVKKVCDLCDKNFSSECVMYRHIRKIHNMKMYKRDPRNTSHKKNYKCNFCTQTFIWRSSLSRHLSAKHDHCKGKKVVLKKPSNNKTLEVPNQSYVDAVVKTFPDDYNYRMTRYKHGEAGTPFFIEFEFVITDIFEISNWKKTYEENNSLLFRKQTVRKSMKPFVVYKEKFICGRNVNVKCKERPRQPGKNTNCPFRLSIRAIQKDPSLIAYIRLIADHNHINDCAASAKYRPVSRKVKENFFCHFNKFTPARALTTYKEDLPNEYGDQFFKVLGPVKPNILVTGDSDPNMVNTNDNSTTKASNDNTTKASNDPEEVDLSFLEKMFEGLRKDMTENPSLIEAAKKMAAAYENMKTASALESAMLCFGKY